MGYGCKPTKYLEGKEKLLIKNKVELKKQPGTQLPKNLAYDLTTLYKQQPNGRWLLFWSSASIYKKNRTRLAQGKKSQKWREKRGEPLAVYDNRMAEETRKTMVYYLNNLGYFDAKVGYEEIPSQENKIGVKYIAEPGPLFTANKVVFKSPDQSIHRIINSIKDKAVLKEGAAISEENFTEEYNRILTYMNNNGYAKMGRNHLVSTGDSTGHKVNVTIEVLPPRGAETHTRFTVGTINVFPDYNATSTAPIQLDTLVDGIHFKYTSKTPNVLPGIILRNIYLRSGIRYSKALTQKTEKLLANLNVFRIVTVKAVPNTMNESIYDYNIYLSPRKKLSAGMSFDFNQTINTINETKTRLLGTGVNFNIRDHNAIQEGIQLSLGVRAGIDINLAGFSDSGQDWLFGADASLNIGLSVPRFVRWLGPYSWLNRITIGENEDGEKKRLLSNDFNRVLRESSKTAHNVLFEYNDIFSFYTLFNFQTDLYTYNIPISNRTGLNITHSGFTVFIPNTRPLFDTLAASNEFLRLSFSRQLFTGLFFKNLNFTHTTGNTNLNKKWDFRLDVELSGLEMFAINSLTNIGKTQKDTIRLFREFEFSQFLRTEFTVSQNRKLTEKTDFAFRFHMGIARAFGFSNDVPYLRQFFGGGPNSMRGWKIRELGPGGFQDTNGITQNRFFPGSRFPIGSKFRISFSLVF